MIKAVFHVDELKKWQITLGNIENLITYAKHHDEEYALVVVGNSEAIKAYVKKAQYAKDIQALMEKGVAFHACQNAMKAQHITGSMLLAGVQIVEAGIVDIIRLQEAGYSYVKP